jgi:hypothetical protein
MIIRTDSVNAASNISSASNDGLGRSHSSGPAGVCCAVATRCGYGLVQVTVGVLAGPLAW